MGYRLPVRFLSLPAALVLSLALAGTSLAAPWGTRVTVATAAFLGDLVTFGDGTAIVAYHKCIDIGGGMCTSKSYVKRSTDGGATWSSKWPLPGEADMVALGGRGAGVDLVWRDHDGGLSYARSANRGASFGAARHLSRSPGTQNPSVARGRGGLVAVAWGEWPQFREQISVRVSTDGGVTFGSKTSWRSALVEWNQVAVGDGVVYVTHQNANGVPVVRRSLDGGETWAKVLTINDAYAPTITAGGGEAYVAWGDRYRRTSNKGLTWSAPRDLVPDSVSTYGADIVMQGGVVRALVETDDGYFYTQSTDGLSWIEPEFVLRGSWAAYVGFAGRPIVLFEREPDLLVKVRSANGVFGVATST